MYNNVTFIGRLGADPSVSQVGENSVGNMSLATWKARRNEKGEWQEQTEWHRIIVWAKNSDSFAAYKKGEMVMFTGEARNREYKDKDGVTRYVTEYVGNIKKIPRVKAEGEANQMSMNPQPIPPSNDLPF